MVGNHVHDIVKRYGSEAGAIPKSLFDYIAGRDGYEHGGAGNTDTELVPDEIVERCCLIGPPNATSNDSGNWRRSASTTTASTSNTTPSTPPCPSRGSGSSRR